MSNAKVLIRPPPHKNFVQGYPSIPADPNHDRPAPHLAGTVEVRPGSKGIYAAYLHIELQKIESIPSPKGLIVNTNHGISRHTDTINSKPVVLWSSPNTARIQDEPAPKSKHKKAAASTSSESPHSRSSSAPFKDSSNLDLSKSIPESKSGASQTSNASAAGVLAWAPLASGDFEFKIDLPQDLPPSLILDSKVRTGISYVLQATLCARPRHPSGSATSWFRRNSSPLLVTASAVVDIVRHDLHSSWPIYQPIPPELRTVEDRGLTMEVTRRTIALGPGDDITAHIKLESQSVHPIKVNRFEINLSEVTCYFHPGKSPKPTKTKSIPDDESNSTVKNNSPPKKETASSPKKSDIPDRKISTVVDVHARVQQTLLHKNCLAFDVRGILPDTHSRVTVNTAQYLSIHYLMHVRAVLEPTGKYSDKKKMPLELIIAELPIIIGDRGRALSKTTIQQIGVVPTLCLPVTTSRPDILRSQTSAPHETHRNNHLGQHPSFRHPQALSPQSITSFTGVGAGVGVPFQYPPLHGNGPRPFPSAITPHHSAHHPAIFFEPHGVPRPGPSDSRQSGHYPSHSHQTQTTSESSRKTTFDPRVSYHQPILNDDPTRARAPKGSFRTTRSSSQPNLESTPEAPEGDPYSRARSATPSRASEVEWPITSINSMPNHPEALRPAPPPPLGAYQRVISGSVDEKQQLFLKAKAEAEHTQSLFHRTTPDTLSRSVTLYSQSSYVPSRNSRMVSLTSTNPLDSPTFGNLDNAVPEQQNSGYATAEDDKRALGASYRNRRVDSIGAGSMLTTTTLPTYGAHVDQTADDNGTGPDISLHLTNQSSHESNSYQAETSMVDHGSSSLYSDRASTPTSLPHHSLPMSTHHTPSPSHRQAPSSSPHYTISPPTHHTLSPSHRHTLSPSPHHTVSSLPLSTLSLSQRHTFSLSPSPQRDHSPPPPPVNLKTRPSFKVGEVTSTETTPNHNVTPIQPIPQPPPTLIDPQREAYLKAVAQREAYLSGQVGMIYEALQNDRDVVVSALEEKARLRLAWETEQRREVMENGNGNGSSSLVGGGGGGNEPFLSPSGSSVASSVVVSPVINPPTINEEEEIGKVVEEVRSKESNGNVGLIRMPTANRKLVTHGNWFD
ncbi:uncharacterized protein MELLADRAFT_113614 [Melampsora larici-populina 98AG31]|uniref:Arrestin C-terminal-like domain-containing protein n=1 Tax=Melampsora larici-populina (strain 98AG31 / pathotype 3-4-7) TaxID=747676 RepID=F4SAH5_MELLP|nr:uncharacterized protein MELLADRAFT_113614 [Melampsora larici-populina 98AG31]EGF98356.1 hypothetical protein MELLADRAFT_113614 [Melampsora larici-populina 98AG31]